MDYLIVDDSSIMRRIISNCVSRLSSILNPQHIYTAATGQEAIDILTVKKRENSLDQLIVILDINMPGGKDGMQVLEDIKLDGALKHIPVILCSSEHDMDTVMEGQKNGADGYIVKPLVLEVIRDKLESAYRHTLERKLTGNPIPK